MKPLAFLQNWALGVCLACVAAGVLQQFFTSRGGVIKLVLTLYILVTALGTAGSAGEMNSITDAFDTHAEPEQTAVDVQSLTLAQAQAGLEQTLMQSQMCIRDRFYAGRRPCGRGCHPEPCRHSGYSKNTARRT